MTTCSVARRSATRGIAALLVGVLVLLNLPWSAAADPGYSGEAQGQVSSSGVLSFEEDGYGETVQLGTSTSGINSEPGMFEDTPLTPADDSQATAGGAATTVQVQASVGQDDPNPVDIREGALSTGAPNSTATDTVTGVQQGDTTVLETARGDSSSQASSDGSTAEATNLSALEGARFTSITVPVGNSSSSVIREADGSIVGSSAASLAGTESERISAIGGYVTVAAIDAAARSAADGLTSNAEISFQVTDLRVHTEPNGTAIIAASARSTDAGQMEVTVTLSPPGAEVRTATFLSPLGADLLAGSTYEGTPLADAFEELQPALQQLIGPGAPFEFMTIQLGQGFAYDGDGTYARSGVTAVEIHATSAGFTVLQDAVLGSANAGVDAVRPFSSAAYSSTEFGIPPDDPPEVLPAGTSHQQTVGAVNPGDTGGMSGPAASSDVDGDQGGSDSPGSGPGGNAEPGADNQFASNELLGSGSEEDIVAVERVFAPSSTTRAVDRLFSSAAARDDEKGLAFTGSDLFRLVELGALLVLVGGVSRLALGRRSPRENQGLLPAS